MAAQGTAGMSIGTGSVSVAGRDWHPSVIYLLVLVIGEMVAFKWLERTLR